jgi:AraC-like DNA-binding protein
MKDSIKLLMFFSEHGLNTSKTKKIIDNHFNENLSILDISNSLKTSHPVMTRLFKKAFALTPLEYRNKLRIFEAQKLFLINPGKVNKTSKLTGFNDQTTFYRHFKNSTLISPKMFSKN